MHIRARQDNEDEGVLDIFCRLHIILRILSWTSLVVAQRVSFHVSLFMNIDLNSCPDQEKKARHETMSRLCPSVLVRNEVHNEFCQNIGCERRQKNEDGIWIHVSLFCPDQGKDLGQHS